MLKPSGNVEIPSTPNGDGNLYSCLFSFFCTYSVEIPSTPNGDGNFPKRVCNLSEILLKYLPLQTETETTDFFVSKSKFNIIFVEIPSTPNGDGNQKNLNSNKDKNVVEIPSTPNGDGNYTLPNLIVIKFSQVEIPSTPNGDGND